MFCCCAAFKKTRLRKEKKQTRRNKRKGSCAAAQTLGEKKRPSAGQLKGLCMRHEATKAGNKNSEEGRDNGMKKIANTFLMSRFLVGGPRATGSDEESGQARRNRLDRRSAPRKAHKNTKSAKPEPRQARPTRKNVQKPRTVKHPKTCGTRRQHVSLYRVIKSPDRWAKESM